MRILQTEWNIARILQDLLVIFFSTMGASYIISCSFYVIFFITEKMPIKHSHVVLHFEMIIVICVPFASDIL